MLYYSLSLVMQQACHYWNYGKCISTFTETLPRRGKLWVDIETILCCVP